MKKLVILIIPAIIGIVGISLKEWMNSDIKLSSLTIENIEALTESTDLPEVTITCSSGTDGQCFIQGNRFAMCGEYMYFPCTFIGVTGVSCTNPPCHNRRSF